MRAWGCALLVRAGMVVESVRRVGGYMIEALHTHALPNSTIHIYTYTRTYHPSDAALRYHGERADFSVYNSSRAKFTVEVSLSYLCLCMYICVCFCICMPLVGGWVMYTHVHMYVYMYVYVNMYVYTSHRPARLGPQRPSIHTYTQINRATPSPS